MTSATTWVASKLYPQLGRSLGSVDEVWPPIIAICGFWRPWLILAAMLCGSSMRDDRFALEEELVDGELGLIGDAGRMDDHEHIDLVVDVSRQSFRPSATS